MTLDQELQLSYYKKAGQVNEAHNIWLVQDVRTNEFLIQKVLRVYHLQVYQQLKDHPVKNTPQIRELIEADGLLYVMEEYIPGKTLEEILQASGPMPEKQVSNIGIQLCVILECFHGLQTPIINRDLKPGNLKLTGDGVLKLLDLNAARPSRPDAQKDTQLLGTAGYAAPEQYGFGASDARTDIYAAGKLMQVLLTGSLEKQVPESSRLASVIAQCTELDPEKRFQSAEALKAALEEKLFGRASSWKRYIKCNFLPGFRTTNPLLWLLSGLIYYLLFYAALTIGHPTLTGFRLSLYRAVVTGMALAIVLVTGNFRNIQFRFLGSCEKLPVRIMKVLAVDFAIFCAALWVISFIF